MVLVNEHTEWRGVRRLGAGCNTICTMLCKRYVYVPRMLTRSYGCDPRLRVMHADWESARQTGEGETAKTDSQSLGMGSLTRRTGADEHRDVVCWDKAITKQSERRTVTANNTR